MALTSSIMAGISGRPEAEGGGLQRHGLHGRRGWDGEGRQGRRGRLLHQGSVHAQAGCFLGKFMLDSQQERLKKYA